MNAQKAYKGMAMEGLIATSYARVTLKDIQRHQVMAALMAPHIPPHGRVLEIAPGPGYFCIELARLGDFQITGLDISRTFVKIASQNAAAAGVPADFRLGDAADLPFEDSTFDFIFCQAAFKNFTRPVKAIAEMQRVLRPGGSAVIVDLRRDASPAEIDQEVEGMGLGALDALWVRLTFRSFLLKNAYTQEEMRVMTAQTPFKTCRVDQGGIGFQVWLTRPPIPA